MIATTRRMAIRDFLLVFTATLVIALSLWPGARARQTVDLSSPQGVSQRYSLALDDPRLEKLRRDLDGWSRGSPHTALAVAKWQAELADYYAQRAQTPAHTAHSTSGIATVSFVDSPRDNPSLPTSGQRWGTYWEEVGSQARHSVAVEHAKLEQHRARTVPPIRFGSVVEVRPPHAFMVSCVLGCLMGSLFAAWTFSCPSIGLLNDSNEANLRRLQGQGSSHPPCAELQLQIPAAWVRVHQPVLVIVRRILYASLVIAGIVCTLF